MSHWIYFIEMGDGGPIKIGYAADPDKRLKQLQVGCPVELHLIGEMRGSREDEQALHVRFDAGRGSGEWFDRNTPGLAHLIADACTENFLRLRHEEAEGDYRNWMRQRSIRTPWEFKHVDGESSLEGLFSAAFDVVRFTPGAEELIDKIMAPRPVSYSQEATR